MNTNTTQTPSYDDRKALTEIVGLTKCGDGYSYEGCSITRCSESWTVTQAIAGPDGMPIENHGFQSIQAACDWIDMF